MLTFDIALSSLCAWQSIIVLCLLTFDTQDEYERVIDQLVTRRQEATALTRKLHVKATEVATIRLV